MTARHTFSGLMELISKALVPAAIAEHVFANKDKIAKAMSETGVYSFETGGSIYEVRIDENV